MKALKTVAKKSTKQQREYQVLLRLIEHFLKTGRAVGSNTLKDLGLNTFSSATIRNYFANLEQEGYLTQTHASGGRIPTSKAYRAYAAEYAGSILNEQQDPFKDLKASETREIAAFLQRAIEKLAWQANASVFLSLPHFEQDFITTIKIISIDSERALCVITTDFGQVMTEILQTGQKLSLFNCKRIESYFKWRIGRQKEPIDLNEFEQTLAQKLYNEIIVRYIVSYSEIAQEGLLRAGLSTLLHYPEFRDPELLTNSLSLFENTQGMRLLLKECAKSEKLKFWIDEDLITYCAGVSSKCTVIAIPYSVNHHIVGAVGLLTPLRIPYRTFFSLLTQFAKNISEALTNNLHKFKITLKQPKLKTIETNASALCQISFKTEIKQIEHYRS